MSLTLQSAETHHLDAVLGVHTAAFGQPDEGRAVSALVNTSACVCSLVGLQQADVVGHILFSHMVTGRGVEFQVAALAPLAVLPAWQQQGIGGKLVESGLAKCRGAGMDAVALIGSPDYYSRFGFESASQYGFTCNYPVPEHVFQIFQFNRATCERHAGTLRFHAAFDGV